MIYGYVNNYKGETIDLFKKTHTDKIIQNDTEDIDLSFLTVGDTLIVNNLKSISGNLKDLLLLAQHVFDMDIKIQTLDEKQENFLENNSAISRMMIEFLAGLNKFDDAFYAQSN